MVLGFDSPILTNMITPRHHLLVLSAGYRHVHITDKNEETINMASLFVHVSIETDS